MEIVPLSSRSKPAMSRSSVVLPLPDAPSTAVIEPSGTTRSTSVSTGVAPNRLATRPELDRAHGRQMPHACGRFPIEPQAEQGAGDHGQRDDHQRVGSGRAVRDVAAGTPRTGSPASARRSGRAPSVAVSSVTAVRKTRQNPARSPGASSGSVTRKKTATGPRPERRPDVGQARRRLGHRGLDADQREREVQDRVGHDEQEARLVQRVGVVGGEEHQAQRDDHAGKRLGSRTCCARGPPGDRSSAGSPSWPRAAPGRQRRGAPRAL